jgi:hypothetical protein
MLKAEGQQSVAFGSAKAEGPVTPVPIMMTVILSTDAEGSVGYVLQTDKKLGQGATTMCVRNRLAKVRLYDPRKPGTPPDVFVKASELAAERRCDSLLAGGGAPTGCASLNNALRESERAGWRVLLQAFNQRMQKNGSYASDNILVTVFANFVAKDDPGRFRGGSINYTTTEGATVIDRVFIDTQITDGGERLIAASDQR